MSQNKRYIIIGLVAAAVLVAGWAAWAWRDSFQTVFSGSGTGQNARTSELETPGPLGDMALGAEDAPVTMVEYASLTCSHCADFHNGALPLLKEKYIDTGKVRLIVREFPFDPLATAGFMLARCAGDERYFGFIDALLLEQFQWMTADQPMAEIEALARQGGFNAEQFRACLEDTAILNHIRDVQGRAQQQLNVRSTPTFFINGEKVEGNLPVEQFEAIIERYLPEEMRSAPGGTPGETESPDDTES